MEKNINKMKIYQNKEGALYRTINTKKGMITRLSDHNLVVITFYINYKENNNIRREIYMFRNPISLQRFKSMTTNTRMFSTIDMKKGSIDDAAKKLINKINGCISRSFTKKRLMQNKRNNTEVNVDKFKLIYLITKRKIWKTSAKPKCGS